MYVETDACSAGGKYAAGDNRSREYERRDVGELPDQSDPNTTNLYVGNIAANVTICCPQSCCVLHCATNTASSSLRPPPLQRHLPLPHYLLPHLLPHQRQGSLQCLYQASEETLQKMFGQYGTITSVKIMWPRKVPQLQLPTTQLAIVVARRTRSEEDNITAALSRSLSGGMPNEPSKRYRCHLDHSIIRPQCEVV